MNNACVQNQDESVSDGQFTELSRSVLLGLTPFVQRLRQIGGTEEFTKGTVVADAVSAALLGLLPKRVKISPDEALWWQKYYSDHYGILADFGGLQVPAPVEYPTRLIVMHAEISNRCNPIIAVYKKRCEGKQAGWYQFADDVDAEVKSHDRSGTYAIRVRAVDESEYGEVDGRNFSTKDALNQGLVATTLPERLVDGDTYLLKTGKHLDRKKVNLCPGTKLLSGSVPSVNFRPGDGRFFISYWGLTNALGYLRFRPAIR